MTKEVKAKIKLRVSGGAATPAPPVGSMLGQHGVNIMDFCKQFNAKTADKKGQTVPVEIVVYVDKSFDFGIKTTPVSELIRKKANDSVERQSTMGITPLSHRYQTNLCFAFGNAFIDYTIEAYLVGLRFGR